MRGRPGVLGSEFTINSSIPRRLSDETVLLRVESPMCFPNFRLISMTLILAGASIVAVGQETESITGPSATAPFQSLHGEWKAARALLNQRSFSDAPQTARDMLLELRKLYTHHFFQLAKQHPADDEWLDCLIWIAANGVPGADFDGMIDFMQSNAKSARNMVQLRLLLSQMIPLESERVTPALAELADVHPDDSVRGAALYALAARRKMLSERYGSLAGCKEAETLLQQVITEFPDVRTYDGQNKVNAERLLRELQGPVSIGKSAPNTTGTALDGKPFDLADYRGKVVVLSFSGHWCVPCREMHGILKQLSENSSDKLAIIEINSDQREKLDDVRQKIEKDHLNWLVITDGPDGPLSKGWNVTSWPTFYVLDQTHHIRRRDVGFIGTKLSDWVVKLITESSAKADANKRVRPEPHSAPRSE